MSPFLTLPIFVSALVAKVGATLTSIASANVPESPVPFVTFTVYGSSAVSYTHQTLPTTPNV